VRGAPIFHGFTYANPYTIEARQSWSSYNYVGFEGSVSVEDIDHIKYHIDWQ